MHDSNRDFMDSGLLKKKKFPIHPTFVLLFLWFVFTKNVFSFILFCSVVLTHELGHYFVAKKLGYKLDSFFIAPYGVSLNYKDVNFESKDEIKIAIAGPLVNFLLSLICVSLWWIVPEVYNFTYEFVFQSFMLGLFNLLPCYPLDGGRVFVGLLSSSSPRTKAVKGAVILNVLFSCLLFVLFFISCFINFNPSLCLCGVMLFLGIIDSKSECKYQPISIYKKKTKNFSKPFFMTINGDVSIGDALKHIELNKYTIFIVLLKENKTKFVDEQALKLLSFKYSITVNFNDIYTK